MYHVPKQLKTSPQSPDLNPIKHLWYVLAQKVKNSNCSNKKEFKAKLLEEWQKISPKLTKKLVHSMPKRLKAVLQTNGYPTKY